MMTSQRPIKVQIFLFTFLLIIVVSLTHPALAAKRPEPEYFLWQYHFYGVVGKNSKISMILTSLRDGKLVGSYRYLKIGAPIGLSGQIAHDGSFDLIEKITTEQGINKTEKITGKIIGRIDASFRTIQGTWSSPDRKKRFRLIWKEPF